LGFVRAVAERVTTRSSRGMNVADVVVHIDYFCRGRIFDAHSNVYQPFLM